MSPVFVLGVLVCIVFCGLTVDIGRMELKKVQLQNAADAGAVGAELESERGTSTWASYALQDAALNGFSNGVNNATMTVAQNPPTGPYAGRYDAIQVNLTQSFKTLFMGVLNNNVYNLPVQSIALVPSCNYFLGGTSSQYSYSLSLTNSSTFNSTCPVYINSNYYADSSSSLLGFGINVSGSSGSSHPGKLTSQQSQGPATPAPQQLPTYGVPVLTDPLTNFGQPAAFNGNCGVTSYKITSGTQTIYPGTYCGTSSTQGLTITGGNVTLSPGLYTITGGMTWNNATVTGNNVTLFFTNGNGASYGQVLIGNSGPCTINLTAASTATNGTQSLLFWLDRAWVPTAAADFQIANAATSFTADGLWYMPATGLSISSAAVSIPHYGSFVTRNASFSAINVTTGQDVSTLTVGSLFRAVVGVLVQ